MAASDARSLPKKAVINRIHWRMRDNLGAMAPSATIDSGLASGAGKAMISKDGGAWANTATVTDAGQGDYYVDLTAGECTADHVSFICKSTTSGVLAYSTDLYLADRDIDDLAFPIASGSGMTTAFGAVVVGDAFASTFAQTGLTTQAGTAQGGASTSITLATSASAVLDYYIGQQVVVTGGPGAGQARLITGYSTGRVATVDRAWATNPTGASTYVVVPNISQSGGLGPASISAATFAAGAIDAAAVATDTITEIALGVLAEVIAEPTGTAAWPASVREALAHLLAERVHKRLQTATAETVRNNADSGNLWTRTKSDDGTTFTVGPAT